MENPQGSRPDEKPRLIIDEDWKEQVQRERQAAQEGAASGTAPGAEPGQKLSSSPDAGSPGPAADAAGQPLEGQFPPATFETLLSMFLTPAMIALGMIADPIDGQQRIDLPQAKFYIDLLDLIEQKTNNNLTAEESQLLNEWLTQLRMAFVARK